MTDLPTDLAHVVSLNGDSVGSSGMTLRDVVVKCDCYFHPTQAAGGWPTEPPAYFGFRYDGLLQCVRQVTSSRHVPNPAANGMPGFKELQGHLVWTPGDHLIHELGPPIRPRHPVPNGPSVLWARHVRAAVDLLLTCDSISEAERLTRERHAGANGSRPGASPGNERQIPSSFRAHRRHRGSGEE